MEKEEKRPGRATWKGGPVFHQRDRNGPKTRGRREIQVEDGGCCIKGERGTGDSLYPAKGPKKGLVPSGVINWNRSGRGNLKVRQISCVLTPSKNEHTRGRQKFPSRLIKGVGLKAKRCETKERSLEAENKFLLTRRTRGG